MIKNRFQIIKKNQLNLLKFLLQRLINPHRLLILSIIRNKRNKYKNLQKIPNNFTVLKDNLKLKNK